jgi:Domain of unknown function (DUF6531)
MRSSRWVVVACLICGFVSMLCWSAAALAEEPTPQDPSLLSGSPLVVSGGESLVGGEEAAEEAKRMSPEAVELREVSASAYEGMSAEAAETVSAEAFPDLINEPDGGGLPHLSAGVAGYLDPYTVELPASGGQRALAVSSVPLAFETSSGGWSPVSLAIHDAGGAFGAASPLVVVRAAKRLSEGVQLSSLGVTVTPVDKQGLPLGGSEGVVDGATVFFANTQTDSDVVFKPSIFGFAIDTLLRSAKSPEKFSFRVGLPAGAALVAEEQGSRMVRIVKEGVTIAIVPAPVARDAAGSPVPVLVGVAGDILTLTVPRGLGEYRYPVDVDPEFRTISEGLVKGNWHHSEAPGGGFVFESGTGLRMLRQGSFPRNNWAYYATQTKGISKIYKQEITDKLEPTDASGINTLPFFSAWLEFFKEGGEKEELVLSGSPYAKTGTLCANTECSPAGGEPGNIARFEVTSTESSAEIVAKGLFTEPVFYGAYLASDTSYISQPWETHSTVAYTTALEELEYVSGGETAKTANVMSASNPGWMGPNSGAFEFKSHDVGLGVAGTSVEVYKASKWETVLSKNYLTEEAGCLGVQCVAEQSEVVVYPALSGHLVNGENKIRVAAHDPMTDTSSSQYGEGEAVLKVDNEAPHNITISGLSVKGETYELGEVEAHLKAEATDGAGSVPSSGIKSLGLEVDGAGVGNLAGSCPSGPCTASGEWAINGAELGTGQHVLTVVATDNAGNISIGKFLLAVYHASPVAMGPGSVNPESGDFALEATDVDLSGGMGPLLVTRHYDSRNLAEGGKGPLGPQWSLSLGSLASLEVLSDGSVMVIGPEGLTHFSKKTGGGFEAPAGDSSLTLELKGSEYVLENKSKGTTTRFTRPSGAEVWMPTTSTGPVATDTMTNEYETVEELSELLHKIVRPRFELAPHPSATCVREISRLVVVRLNSRTERKRKQKAKIKANGVNTRVV